MKKTYKEIQTAIEQAKDVDFDTIENKKKILRFLSRLSASYIAEIAWETGLSEYQARIILNELFHNDMIQREMVTYEGNPCLIVRVPEMAAIGQSGMANFQKKRWYSITEKGRGEIDD